MRGTPCQRLPRKASWHLRKRRLSSPLAVATYIGDENVARKEAADGWNRDLDFVVPVRDPELWTGAEESLSRTLHTLSGDDFSFVWEKCDSVPRRQRHRRKLPTGYDTVCLFSGGMDSLMGAYGLLKEGRKVILVGHQSDGITASVQKELARDLRRQFPGQATFVQCRVARSRTESPLYRLPGTGRQKIEDTHRTRSFLFLCLAVGVASTTKIDRIWMPENGLIALNVPVQLCRFGSASTRTAHPLFLTRFLETMQALDVFTGELRNPLLYESKTDLLKDLDDPLASLMSKTVSCARPGRVPVRGKRHCGYCIPCLYRRVAMAEAGLDDADDYWVNVFDTLPGETATKQADMRGLVRFAKRVITANAAERQAMLFSHGHFAADVGGTIGPYTADDYTPWSDMLFRWADDFLDKVRTWSSPKTRKFLAVRK